MAEDKKNVGSSKTVGELELGGVVEVTPQSTVLDACKLMAEKGIDSVLVLDRSGTGVKPEALRKPNIRGIVTVKDVTYKVIAKEADPSKTPVSRSLMNHWYCRIIPFAASCTTKSSLPYNDPSRLN